jgi:hypothetical protein
VSAPPAVVRISDEGRQVVDIIHRESDAGMWIVRRRRRFLWMKIVVSRDWFNDEEQALAFARSGGGGPPRT